MKRIVKKIMIGSMALAVITGLITGCGKEEKQFDFESTAAVKVFTNNNEESLAIIEKEQAQKLVTPIAEITWAENKEESTQEYDDWSYRILCYDAKGEKKQNIIICSESRILYSGHFWDAEDGQLDMTQYEALFQEE